MFRKLRNKLIWINLGVTSVVILTVFTAIYLVSTRSAENRPVFDNAEVIVDDNGGNAENVRNYIILSMREEKKTAAETLLLSLVVSGVAIEVMVAVISYFMAEEAIKPVREAYEAQKIFIANASHEIKTPLAAIQANLEAAEIEGNKWIDNVEFEAGRLAELNSELLALARTDLVGRGEVVTVNLGEMVRREIGILEPRLEGKKLVCRIELPEKMKIAAADFMQVFGILMDNAVKYSEGLVRVGLDAHELVVTNDGAGISKEDLPRVFDRFYQSDKAAEGVGLGLSIAKAVAERNGWKLKAESGKEHEDETKNRTSFLLTF